MNKKIGIIGTLLAVMALMALIAVVPAGAADPTNASTTVVDNASYSGASTAGSSAATGGNITEVNLNVGSKTTKWQGYYGNISGGIQLASSSENIMYNWTSDPVGEVYATQDNIVNASEWANLTNKTGTDIDSVFFSGISATDNATNTFTVTSTAFNVSGRTIGSNASSSVKTKNNAGTATWETIALGPASISALEYTKLVFAAIIRGDSTGEAYDGTTKDFQMIVPVNGTQTYYFYVELD